MQGEQNLKELKRGLETLNKVFDKQNVNYRVLGSVLVAALNGRPHRTIGDIDILLEQRYFKKVIEDLKSTGYKLVKKRMLGLTWFEAHKSKTIGFTFLLIGNFSNDYFTYKIGVFELRISNSYLAPTSYSLLGYSFTGLPLSSVYEGLKISNLNPKRTFDNKIVRRIYKTETPRNATLEKSFKIYVLGIEIPQLYTFFSKLYNFYGGFRVRFGKKYEIWD